MKLLHIEDKERIKRPFYEITCPACGNKIVFEEYLFASCPAVYCHFCKHKINTKEQTIST